MFCIFYKLSYVCNKNACNFISLYNTLKTFQSLKYIYLKVPYM